MQNNQNLSDQEPLIPASTTLPEFTIKSIILSIILAVVLSASNAYLALKVGVTISASIPASVLALGILRLFKTHNVLESNLVQTAASAGEGVAAALAFILPAMIILHVWVGFPYWQTAIITLLGGFLGVLFAVPLRRVLLSLPGLPFPEGAAIGNVLKASTEGGLGLKLMSLGGLVGGLVSLFQTGFKIVASDLQIWVLSTRTVFGFALGFTPAVLAAGYIIGFEVGMSLFAGVVVGWIVLLPMIGSIYGIPSGHTAYDVSVYLWSNYLRYVGVGTMLVGGIWTLIRLLKPIVKGLTVSFITLRKQNRAGGGGRLRTETDIPVSWVLASVLVLALLMFAFLHFYFASLGFFHEPRYMWFVILLSVFYILIIGFLLATISGYFCGLVGSSNNPLSGMLISAILLLAFIFLFMFHVETAIKAKYIASAVIVIVTIMAGVGSISGENIQDLKAGKMVGATPWRQQLMMGIGVIVSAFIIGPVLELLFNAYGMAGVYPRPGMDPTQMLAAPQAGLMASVAEGVLTRHLNWWMIFTGGVVAVVIIIADEFLKRKNFRLPALAVGLGIYLPPEVIMPAVIGGVVSYLVKRQRRGVKLSSAQQEAKRSKYQLGVLLACGMVAGSALMGVILAIPFALLGSADALKLVGSGFEPVAKVLGVLVFLGLCYWLYRTGRFRNKDLNEIK